MSASGVAAAHVQDRTREALWNSLNLDGAAESKEAMLRKTTPVLFGQFMEDKATEGFSDEDYRAREGTGIEAWPEGLASYLHPPPSATYVNGGRRREPTVIGCHAGPLRLDCCAPCCFASCMTALETAPIRDRTGADTAGMMSSCCGFRVGCCTPLLDSCYPTARTQIDCCEAQCCGKYLGCLGDPLKCCCQSDEDELEKDQRHPVEARLADCNLCCESLWMGCWCRELKSLWGMCCGANDEVGGAATSDSGKEEFLCGCHCMSARCACGPACSECCAADRATDRLVSGSTDAGKAKAEVNPAGGSATSQYKHAARADMV